MSNKVTKFINNHFVDTSWSTYFTEDGYQRFRTFFGRVVAGQPKVYDTPFAKGTSTQDLLREWNSILEPIQREWPTLWDFEQEMRDKVGPLSVMLPLKDRLDDIRHYYDDIKLSSQPISDQAMLATKAEFLPLRGLRVRGRDRTVDLMKKSTNSGNPYWTKRRNVVQETLNTQVWAVDNPIYYHSCVEMRMPGNQFLEAGAVVGWRGQEGGPKEDDVKQRVVWMFPFAVNAAELQVYQPLIEACQKRRLVPAWISMDMVDERITKLFDTKPREDLVICTDFSKFDQHFNSDLQHAAKSILQFVLTPDQRSTEWLEYIFPIKYMIPLIWEATDSTVSAFHGAHGMGSGSGGTNADETLAHRALQHEAAISHSQSLNLNSMCLGDDGVLTYPGISVEDVVEAYQSHGQECNIEKQYASSQDCVYLRRWHHTNYRSGGVCVGVYPTNRAIGRLRYLERFMDPEVWSPEMVALRQLSIVENCKHHPMKEQFAQFCMKRDKYRLGIDLPGFLDNIVHLAKESIDYMPDFLGYTKTLQGFKPDGIAEWWIVKYLKSIR